MKPITGKARDLVIFGGTMAVTAVAWLVLGDAKFLAITFIAFGIVALAQAFHAWATSA